MFDYRVPLDNNCRQIFNLYDAFRFLGSKKKPSLVNLKRNRFYCMSLGCLQYQCESWWTNLRKRQKSRKVYSQKQSRGHARERSGYTLPLAVRLWTLSAIFTAGFLNVLQPQNMLLLLPHLWGLPHETKFLAGASYWSILGPHASCQRAGIGIICPF